VGNIKEIVVEGMDWIQLSPVVGSCENSNEPSGSIKDGKYLNHLSFLFSFS
jgi:hypothetical protein